MWRIVVLLVLFVNGLAFLFASESYAIGGNSEFIRQNQKFEKAQSEAVSKAFCALDRHLSAESDFAGNPTDRDMVGGAHPTIDNTQAAAKRKALDQAPDAEPSDKISDIQDPQSQAGTILSQGKKIANENQTAGIHGFAKNETAYRISSPTEFTKIKNILFITTDGHLAPNIGYKATGRFYYDAVFDLTDTYSKAVEQDQEAESELRDTFIDISNGGFDLRLGNQQIVWGEAVGLFFADVVNPKDLREFILPNFDQIRIPVWSADMEYYRAGNHLELVWIPWPKFNRLGVPGSEFAFATPPLPSGVLIQYGDEKKPSKKLENSEAGVRVSRSVDGWDFAGFYLYGYDYFPTLFRRINLDPGTGQITCAFQPEYKRLNVFGLTFAKEIRDVILKGEFVFNKGKYFQVNDLADVDGVVKKDFLDYLIGVDYTFFHKIDFNFQFMQRVIANHDNSMIDNRTSTSFSIWLKSGLLDNLLQPELFFVSSLDRQDWMLRPKISYIFRNKWTAALGVDIFEGKTNGTFGQFDNRDRAYIEVRRDF